MSVSFEARFGLKEMVINVYNPLPAPTEEDMARVDLKLVQDTYCGGKVPGVVVVRETSQSGGAAKMGVIARTEGAAESGEAADSEQALTTEELNKA